MAKPTFERVPDFVPVSLRYAYLSTEILVSLDGEWQPMMQLPELDAGSVIVLTAHNPRSQRLSDSDNQERNDALAAQLAESGHEVRPAEAFDLHSDWSESSFVVDGLSHKAMGSKSWLHAEQQRSQHCHGTCPELPPAFHWLPLKPEPRETSAIGGDHQD